MNPVALIDPKELGSLAVQGPPSRAQLIEVRSVSLGGTAQPLIPFVTRKGEAAGKMSNPWRDLLVDDDGDFAWSFATILERKGHEVRTATDGESALRLAESFQPKLAILDIAMPEMDGYQVCRCLRATRSGRRMVILALTGLSQKSDRRRSRIAGFDMHMLKPVDPAELDRVFNYLTPRSGAIDCNSGVPTRPNRALASARYASSP